MFQAKRGRLVSPWRVARPAAGYENGVLKRMVRSLEFPDKHKQVSGGPAGGGKSFLAEAMGYLAIRAGQAVSFVHADDFFRALARLGRSMGGSGFRSFLTTDLLVVDDIGLYRLTAHQPLVLFGGPVVGRYHAGTIHLGEFCQQGRGCQRLVRSDRLTRT